MPADENSMGIDAARRNTKSLPLTRDERARLEEFIDNIHYSARFVACLLIALTALQASY